MRLLLSRVKTRSGADRSEETIAHHDLLGRAEWSHSMNGKGSADSGRRRIRRADRRRLPSGSTCRRERCRHMVALIVLMVSPGTAVSMGTLWPSKLRELPERHRSVRRSGASVRSHMCSAPSCQFEVDGRCQGTGTLCIISFRHSARHPARLAWVNARVVYMVLYEKSICACPSLGQLVRVGKRRTNCVSSLNLSGVLRAECKVTCRAYFRWMYLGPSRNPSSLRGNSSRADEPSHMLA
jgi:hypothetical protein